MVLTSLLMVAVLAMAAIVVDLGAMRAARSSNQSLTDFAALAAGDALADDDGPNGPAACHDAVRYLRLNADALSDLVVDCSGLPHPCDASTAPATVGQVAGDYAVAITHPVADATIADDDVSSPAGLRLDDGEPCERLRVEVKRHTQSAFAGVIGFDDLTVGASSVVRGLHVRHRQVPSLWLLDPYGCDALTVQGGAKVTVGSADIGGLVSLDSAGTACSGTSYTVDVGGSGSRLHAVPADTEPPGRISLFAMVSGQTTCDSGNPAACDPADVDNGTLSPQPERRPFRATRAPIDHRYNCRSSQDAYPDYHGIEVPDCDAASAPHIDDLRATVGDAGVPAGFQRWSDHFGCANPATPASGVDGDWVVDCGTFRIGSGTEVVFNGGNVVFDGDIAMTGGQLSFNTANPESQLPAECQQRIAGCATASSEHAAWVYLRSGNLRLSGGVLHAHRTAIYQHDGYFNIAGGSPPVWSAPAEGPLAGLAIWSEEPSSRFNINGGASMELEGVFFTPEADPFTLSGGAPFTPQQAQFISFRAKIDGGADLELAPNEAQGLTIPAPPPLLIR